MRIELECMVMVPKYVSLEDLTRAFGPLESLLKIKCSLVISE